MLLGPALNSERPAGKAGNPKTPNQAWKAKKLKPASSRETRSTVRPAGSVQMHSLLLGLFKASVEL